MTRFWHEVEQYRRVPCRREDQRRFPGGHPESWSAWWQAAAADPALAARVAERERRRVKAGHHGSESTQLAVHVEALKAVGFAEIGTLWQRGDNRLLCGILPVNHDRNGEVSHKITA